VLLNTWLNIKGEPIWRKAVRAFYDTGLDHLVLGDYLLSKPD
jgi:predicted NodU family carbamoyl transferase